MQRSLPVGWAAAIVASSVALAATSLWMAATPKCNPKPILPDGIAQPILALELARSPSEVGEILRVPDSQHNRDVLAAQIEKDWVFIAAYAGFFAALASSQFQGNDPVRRGLGWVIAMGILATALFDVFENLGMLKILGAKWLDLGEPMVAATRIWSLWKWFTLFTTCLFAGLLFLDWRRRSGMLPRSIGLIAKATGLLFLASGLIGLGGLASPGLIGPGMVALSAAMLLTSVLASLVFVPWRAHRLREIVLLGLVPPRASAVATEASP